MELYVTHLHQTVTLGWHTTPMTEHPTHRIEAPGKPGKALIAELEGLRDRRRLGIHMWEQRLDYSFPRYADGLFTHTEPAPQISASLLPTMEDGMGMRPFGCTPDAISRNLGYLVDLDETREHPVQLLAGNERVMESGNDEFRKRIANQDRGRTLDEVGEKTASDRELAFEHWAQAASDSLVCNEIILHAQPEHRRAIVVPNYASSISPRWYDPVRLITAAMAGIDHQNNGIDLPVVEYDVHHGGALHYVGRSTPELNKVAGQSLKTLLQNPEVMASLERRWEYKWLVPAVQEHFGVDLTKPLLAQHDALARLDGANEGRSRS